MHRAKKKQELTGFLENLKKAIDPKCKIEIIKSITDDELFGAKMGQRMKSSPIACVVLKTAKTIKALERYIQFVRDSLHKRIINGIPIDADDFEPQTEDTSAADGLILYGSMITVFNYEMPVRNIKHALERLSECIICLDDFEHHREAMISCRHCSARVCIKCHIALILEEIAGRPINCQKDFELECSQCRQIYYDAAEIEKTILNIKRLSSLKGKLELLQGSDRHVLNLIMMMLIEFNIGGRFDDKLFEPTLFVNSIRAIILEAKKRGVEVLIDLE